MKKIKKDLEILDPKRQLSLFGYNSIFNSFIKLFEQKRLPNTILLSGPKGSGKSTFIYHFVNYLFSKHEKNKYSISNFSINENNSSYKLVNDNTHPNFFSIENIALEKDIKIDQIRNLSKFLSKSSYLNNVKIVLINNAEYLNLNSSNALLKALEEPNENTFFFIIHNNSLKILETIKSRCIKFKIFHDLSKKKEIFNNIIKQYNSEFDEDTVDDFLNFDTPGNLIKYSMLLGRENINFAENKISSILFFMDKYKNEKNPETLSFLSFFICKFYNELCLNSNDISLYLFNQSKILKEIDNMKKFNLNEKNTLVWIKEVLLNEKK
tara:strand:+ start:177 stop:1148 length:972 start_codon:yes stop_codon:yes gene_type:complete